MVINTHIHLPPMIRQNFNRYLLDPLFGMFMHVKETLIPLANKKIRPQDIGKRRQFDALLKEFNETYERKKIEEANYNAEIKEKISKRPRTPTKSTTMCFKRMETS